jgi:hypothetical protein
VSQNGKSRFLEAKTVDVRRENLRGPLEVRSQTTLEADRKSATFPGPWGLGLEIEASPHRTSSKDFP